MTETLGVAVNKNGLHTLEVQESFESDGPFVVELRNHGEATHVHLNLDDRLSQVARVGATNHYIGGGESRAIEIDVRDPDEWPNDLVRGKLKVVIAHGQETHYVDVTLDRTRRRQPVEVDPELSQPTDEEETSVSPELRAVPVAVLGAVALLLAAGSLLAAEGIDFALGGFAVVAAALCAVAAYYLLR